MGADQVVVFDTTTQQVVGTVDGLKTPTGVLAVPELNRLFVAAAGSHDVAVIDTESLRVVAHTGQIDFPDGLDYVPAVKQVFVSDESGGGELVIDATTNEVVTIIDIDGEAGNTHYDPSSESFWLRSRIRTSSRSSIPPPIVSSVATTWMSTARARTAS